MKKQASAEKIDADTPAESTLEQRYANLSTDKDIYLQRARACAKVTIPFLFPPQGHSSASNYPTPFQSTGADGVNNLGAKIVLALFPPGEPFFKLVLSPKAKNAIKEEQKDSTDGEDMRANLEAGLGLTEDEVTEELESHGSRVAKTEAIQQLLVSGNSLIEVKADNRMLCHHLENYVVRRDVDGHPIEVIIRQTLKRQSLPKEALDFLKTIERHHIRPALATETDKSQADRTTTMEPGTIDLFTGATLMADTGKWNVRQELMGKIVPKTDGTWPGDTSGFIPLVWRRIQGEHYGRGFVEQYLGDLNSLETMTQAIVEGAAIASRVIPVVDETGLTSAAEITNAPNGEAVNGEVKAGVVQNIGFVKLDKATDFTFVLTAMEKITERLDRAFMRVQGRDAERVTAEEIRMLAKDLEAALGGAYAILAQEFQRPLVRRVMLNMQKSGKLKHFPKDMVRPEVVAGLDGLGRDADVQKLTQLFTLMGQAFGPQAAAAAFNMDSAIARFGAALNIDTTGLAKSQQQQQAEAQAAQTADQQKTLGPHLIKAASDQAKSMRENPGSPVDQQPGGALGAVMQGGGGAVGNSSPR